MALDQGFPPTPGSLIDGKYIVSELLGTGGTGVVCAAHHLGLGRLVAIKFLQPDLAAAPNIVARFLREARATSRLKSEHVVGIFDVGTLANGVPYLVMEHLTGVDLASRLQQRGPCSVPEVLDYAIQTLEAIAEAHRHGIVHRDLKPANLLLTTREDDSDFIKVLDFGTSKFTSRELESAEITRPGSFLGSPLYMSPEQIKNARDVDARSDLWSLGVVMHELLTGHPPFNGEYMAELIGSIFGDEYAVPARDDLPAELAEILRRCLQKEPEERYQSAEELARAFLPLISTVACQVSIERILRVPSSAPPPELMDADAVLDMDEQPTPLVGAETAYTHVSVAPHASGPRESWVQRGRNTWVAPLAALGIVLAAAATWLHLRAVPLATPRTADAARSLPAAPAPPSSAFAPAAQPAPALTLAQIEIGPASPKPARRSALRVQTSGSESSATPAPASAPAKARGAPLRAAFPNGVRSLDHENPFAAR